MLVINGRPFIDGAFRDGVNIRVRDGRIVQVGLLCAETDEAVIDAAGAAVVPGFVDIHIHGFAGCDCMDGEESVRHMSREMKKTGVAAFVPTTMSAGAAATRAALAGIEAVCAAQEPNGAYVLGAHMEAPFLNEAYCGAQETEYFLEASVRAYDALVSGHDGCVRMMTLAPEREGAAELIAYLKEKGVVSCCAHSGAMAEQVHAAADAGLTQITHLFNAQTPLKHREPGVPGAGLADDRLCVQVIADCIHLHPDVLRIAALCKADGRRMLLITDAMMAAGMPDGEYTLGSQKVFVKEGAARLENGALAGSTLTMARAVKNMITRAGVAPEKVIPMATSAPADSIGARGFGRIEPGYDATMVMMDENWDVAGVI